MHGRVKVRTTAEQEEIKRKEREKKLKFYTDATERVFQKRKNEEYDEEALNICSEILAVNPDFYTLWNFRKEIFSSLKGKRSEDNIQKLFDGELYFLENCLKINPKSYGVWDHRCFVMDNMPHPDWQRELMLCNKFLEYDERNFHCWDYRRFVVKRAQVTIQEEFDFTSRKISSNFSNYSSWHYRSKLIPLMFPDPDSPMGVQEEALLKEFETVQSAFFTDPDDQSAWFYHRWLLGRAKIKLAFQCAYASRKQKIAINFTKPVNLLQGIYVVDLKINKTQVEYKCRNPFNTSLYSTLWLLDLPDGLLSNTQKEEISMALKEDSVVVCECCLTLASDTAENWCMVNRKPGVIFGWELTSAKITILEQELQSILDLLELEPENKWAILTALLLMKALDPSEYDSKIKSYIRQLQNIDAKRTAYYKDLRSKFVMENAIETMRIEDQTMELTGQELSVVYHLELLLPVKKLDLSNNQLRSVRNFGYLQFLESLNVDDNQLVCVSGLQHLPCLKSLSVRQNCLASVDALQPLTGCTQLKKLDLKGNPLCQNGYKIRVRELLPFLMLLDGEPAS